MPRLSRVPMIRCAAPSAHRGVALLEALVAILIFSFGILGLVGLQAVTMQSTSVAKARVDASLIASQRIAEIWGDFANIATIPDENNVPVGELPDGKRTTTIDGNTVTVTVTWKMPAEAERQTYSTVAVVVGK